ncbi:MAG: hypothetical protein K5739_06625 [Lachnospiraceae bacterium]|nr:hypothetical protein [Lachnospiraceae bacterium]
MKTRNSIKTLIGMMLCLGLLIICSGEALAGTAQAPTPVTFGQEMSVNRQAVDGNSYEYFMISAPVGSYISYNFRNPGRSYYSVEILSGPDTGYNNFVSMGVYSGDSKTEDAILPAAKCLVVFKSEYNDPMIANFTINIIPDDFPNTFNTAKVIGFGQTIDGSIEIDNDREVDFFTFTTDASDSFYGINIGSKTKSTTEIQIYDGHDETYKIENGNFSCSGGNTNYRILKLEKNKTYWIKVFGGYWDDTVNYRLTVYKYQDDAGDDWDHAKGAKVNQKVSGSFQSESGYSSADDDFYQIKTTKNKEYWLELNNKSQNGGFRVTVYSRANDESSKLKDVSSVYVYSGNKNEYKLHLSGKHVYYIKFYDGGLNNGYSFCLHESVKSIKKDKPKSLKTSDGYSATYLSFKSNNRYNGVEVWRSYRSGGGFRKVKVLKKGYTSFTDYGVKRRSRAYYKIRYYVKDGKKTKYSKFTKVKSAVRRY